VRNLIRARGDREVAKKISGHKTDSMFSRYNITDERDQRAALRLWTSTSGRARIRR